MKPFAGRFGKGLGGLLAELESLAQKSLAEDIDTTISAGRLFLHLFASVAQFECERVFERSKEGLQGAFGALRLGSHGMTMAA